MSGSDDSSGKKSLSAVKQRESKPGVRGVVGSESGPSCDVILCCCDVILCCDDVNLHISGVISIYASLGQYFVESISDLADNF